MTIIDGDQAKTEQLVELEGMVDGQGDGTLIGWPRRDGSAFYEIAFEE